VIEFFFGKAGGKIGQTGKASDFEAEGAGLDHFDCQRELRPEPRMIAISTS
jgi:hypothetical protein